MFVLNHGVSLVHFRSDWFTVRLSIFPSYLSKSAIPILEDSPVNTTANSFSPLITSAALELVGWLSFESKINCCASFYLVPRAWWSLCTAVNFKIRFFSLNSSWLSVFLLLSPKIGISFLTESYFLLFSKIPKRIKLKIFFNPLVPRGVLSHVHYC